MSRAALALVLALVVTLPHLAAAQAKPGRHAVRGMVPKNRLGRVLMTKLKVYKGAEHPHAAQMPDSLAPAK